MPDSRYDGYEQRPRQGAGNSSNMRNGGAYRTGSAARPAGGGQTRPVQQGTRPQPRPQGAGTAQRGANSAPRQAAPQRGYASTGRPAQPGAARPAALSGQARPYQARPAGQSRPQGGAASSARPRPAQNGSAQQRRPAPYNPASGARPARPAAQTGGVQRRPAQGGGYGYSGASGGGFKMPPALRAVCFVLVVAILMTTSIVIAEKVRSGQPRPIISMNTADPMTQATGQLTASATDAPAANATDAPASAATDAPASPTNTPSAPAGNTTATGSGRTATIRAIGDVILDDQSLENCEIGDEVYEFSQLFELVGGVMSDADLTMINIEATLRRGKYGYAGYPQFSTPHSILEDLKEVGVDMLTMCNNHALDGYYDGLKMSLDYADEAGLLHVGAYRTQEEHDTPEVYDIGGIKVGMLNYTQYTNSMAQYCDEEATIYGMRLMDGADYEGDIADLKAAGAEFTVVIMHWGEEYIREPEESTKAVARRLVAAGADLVIGGHPHVVQPAEYITATQADGSSNTALVVYSIGNFYSEHRHKNKAYTDNGVIFEFTLSENAQGEIEMNSPAFIPVYMWQTEGGGAYEFRAVPSGVYLNTPPAGMSSEEYERMTASYNEIVELVNGVIEVRAE